MRDAVKNIARVSILLWFIAVSIFVLFPSYQVLWGTSSTLNSALPQPPPPPTLKDTNWIDPKEAPAVLSQRIEAYKQQIQLYGQRVQAYQSEATAYTKYLDERAKILNANSPTRSDAYSLVVKGTLASLLNTTLVSLLTFAFVSAGAQVASNYVRAQKGEPTEKLEVL